MNKEVPEFPEIIIVDDEEAFLKILERILKGYSTTLTTSPKEALSLLGEKKFHILITDINMSEMNGMDLIAHAKKVNPELLAIVVSGDGNKDNYVAAIKKGVYDFIEKPFNSGLVRETIIKAWRSLRNELINQQLLKELSVANENLKLEIIEKEKNELERKRLEKELFLAQKLESVGQLAAGIAHEINTPIQYVGDNIRFLEEVVQDLVKYQNEHDIFFERTKKGLALEQISEKLVRLKKELDVDYIKGESLKAVKAATEGIERIRDIVLAMKEFSHPGTSEKISIDINKALENTLLITKNEWKYIAKVNKNFDKNITRIYGYPGEINQVFLNLIVNAAQAIDESLKKQSHSEGIINISTEKTDQGVKIKVGDTGCGISKNHKDKIFEPFFTTKEVGKGTGQGLALVYSIIVKRHNGRIDFESQIDKGTTFTIELK